MRFCPLGKTGAPLAEFSRTAYLPSASTLVHLRSLPLQNTGKRLLALGDPIYGGATKSERAAALAEIGTLGALPHTRQEVMALRSLYGRRFSTLLTGPEATEANLKRQELSRYSIVHLASHGWIDASSPSRSGLVLGYDPGQQEDGILQVREILRLPLRANLVTLSACQSALGSLITGEGMVGLSRAFFYAGTDTVVASLWNVNDEASADFMSAFYGNLRQGLAKAEALRLARMQIRKNPRYQHPYFWAPYILIGEGSSRVEFPRDWTLAVLFVLTLALSGAAIFVRWRRRRARPGYREIS